MGIRIAGTCCSGTQAHEQAADLAIIGGGPACVALLHRLARARQTALTGRIDIFEKRKRLGPGGAYEPPDSALLMNTPVSYLNITGDPHHLHAWLEPRGLTQPIPSGDVCLSRSEYGRYLEHIGTSAIQSLARIQTRVSHRRHEVVDLSPLRGNGFELKASNGSAYRARRVVLAIGDPAPSLNLAFDGLPGYIDSPACFAELAKVPRDAPVVVLGAGASAVDCCLYLHRKCGHQGPMVLVSRSGHLPCVLSARPPVGGVAHNNVLALLARRGSRLSLADMVSAVEQDLSAWLKEPVSVTPEFSPHRTPERTFYRDVLRSERGLPGPQDYIRSLRRVAPDLWHRLTLEDRRLFDETYRSRWDRYRHPIPLGAARPLMHMLRLGHVRVLKASQDPFYREGKFVIHHSGAAQVDFQAPYLIQATGLELDATRDRSRLIHALLQRDLGRAHPSGGLCVKPNLQLLSCSGEEYEIFLMGSRTRGSTFATASIRSIAHAAASIAEELGDPCNKNA